MANCFPLDKVAKADIFSSKMHKEGVAPISAVLRRTHFSQHSLVKKMKKQPLEVL